MSDRVWNHHRPSLSVTSILSVSECLCGCRFHMSVPAACSPFLDRWCDVNCPRSAAAAPNPGVALLHNTLCRCDTVCWWHSILHAVSKQLMLCAQKEAAAADTLRSIP